MKDLTEIEDLEKYLDTDDVAQKRYLMFHIFETLVEARLSSEEIDSDVTERISHLKQVDGYMYKISQDFLTSSSTLEKQNKLEKIIKHVKRKKD